MLPSLFSLPGPVGLHITLLVIYGYVLPIMLYALWACLSLMDLASSGRIRNAWTVGVLIFPWAGGAVYLLCCATQLSRASRRAAVAVGLLVWLLPFAYVLHGAWGPLGPKAL